LLRQGPPGTGKTTTAISLISLWLLAGRGPVLATSDSNIAVDNLLEGCIRAGMRVVRLGRAEAVRPDLNDYMLENQARQKCPGGPAADRTAFHQAMQSILKQASVVCATCSGAGGEIVSRCSFPSVLLDEASQVTINPPYPTQARTCTQTHTH
jgi:superfamily I DNA and/or RNA helicase